MAFLSNDDQDVIDHARTHPADTPIDIIDRSHEHGFVAVVAGLPVGQITWTFEQDLDVYDDAMAATAKGDYNGYHLRIAALIVEVPFRRRGVATALFRRFAEFADTNYGLVNGPGSGWDPGEFTADGAALYEAVTGQTVPITHRIIQEPQ